MRQHRNTCAERSTRAAARKSLQAQLAAGRGPGVGASSPCPRGCEPSERRGGSAPPARTRRVAACASKETPARSAARARERAKACKLSLPRVGGPGVGARSPSPPGTASSASGAAGARRQRAHGGSLHAPAQKHLREAQHAPAHTAGRTTRRHSQHHTQHPDQTIRGKGHKAPSPWKRRKLTPALSP